MKVKGGVSKTITRRAMSFDSPDIQTTDYKSFTFFKNPTYIHPGGYTPLEDAVKSRRE